MFYQFCHYLESAYLKGRNIFRIYICDFRPCSQKLLPQKWRKKNLLQKTLRFSKKKVQKLNRICKNLCYKADLFGVLNYKNKFRKKKFPKDLFLNMDSCCLWYFATFSLQFKFCFVTFFISILLIVYRCIHLAIIKVHLNVCAFECFQSLKELCNDQVKTKCIMGFPGL